jgi:hypothetical protein
MHDVIPVRAEELRLKSLSGDAEICLETCRPAEEIRMTDEHAVDVYLQNLGRHLTVLRAGLRHRLE